MSVFFLILIWGGGQYEEREDEFDFKPPEPMEETADEDIDIVSAEPSELAHIPDVDDDDRDLAFLPTRPGKKQNQILRCGEKRVCDRW